MLLSQKWYLTTLSPFQSRSANKNLLFFLIFTFLLLGPLVLYHSVFYKRLKPESPRVRTLEIQLRRLRVQYLLPNI